MERDRPWWGVTNDAVVRLPDHAPDRAIRTNACSVFVRTTRPAMSIRTLTWTHQLVASARAGYGHNVAPDNLGALELVEASEASTGSVVEEAMGDAAYGDGGTRQTFADAGRRLVAKVPGRPDRKHFPKMTFTLTWPRAVAPVRRGRLPTPSCRRESGRIAPVVSTDCRLSQFDGAVCGVCPLRSQCIAAQGRQGRRVLIHPQEGMLQTGPGPAAKRRLRRVSSATGGSGAQIGPAGPAGHPAGPLLR